MATAKKPAAKAKPKAKIPAKKQTKKVMDVARPGKTAPSASARPVIVGHKPTVQDPMVNEGKKMPNDEDSEEHKIDVKRTAPKVVMPLSAAEKEAVGVPETDDSPSDKAIIPDAVAATAKEPEEATPESEQAEAAADTTPDGTEPLPDAITVDETQADPEASAGMHADPPDTPATPEKDTSSADTGKESSGKDSSSSSDTSKDKSKGGNDNGSKDKKDDKKNVELERRLAEIEKLSDEKTYYVHTSHTSKKQRKTGYLVLVLLLLLTVGAYLALDAQVIKNDIELPYEFFKEEVVEDADRDVPTISTPTPKPTGKEEVPAAAYTGQVVESSGKAFSLKIPDGWSVAVIKGDDFIPAYHTDNLADALTYKSGTKPIITELDGYGTDAPIRFNAIFFKPDEQHAFTQADTTQTVFTTTAGVKGTRYYRQEPRKDVEGIGPYPGEKSYTYEFKTSKGTMIITYRLLEKNQFNPANQLPESDPDRLDLVEQVVKSLKLN